MSRRRFLCFPDWRTETLPPFPARSTNHHGKTDCFRPGAAGPEAGRPPCACAAKMADLHRQLQEYLSQGKAGGGEAAEPLLAPEAEGAAGGEPAPAWLDRVGLRWARKEPAAAGSAWLPSLGRAQRLAAGSACLLLAAFCLGLSLLYAPALLLRARKFALLWSLGSVLALAGGALLGGGAVCARRPSGPALLYGVALGATLYAALGLRSTPWTALGACAQVAALLAALVDLLPRGTGAALRLLLGRLKPGARLAQALPV